MDTSDRKFFELLLDLAFTLASFYELDLTPVMRRHVEFLSTAYFLVRSYYSFFEPSSTNG